MVEAEIPQRDPLAADQEWLTQMIQVVVKLVDRVELDFTVSQAEAEAEVVELVAQDQMVEAKVVETILAHQEKALLKTQALAEDAVEAVDLEFV